MQFIIKQLFSFKGYIIAFIIICIIAPFLFPFTLFHLFKKVIGYKSKLEKQADEESRKIKESQENATDFMKDEGVVAYETNFPEPKEDRTCNNSCSVVCGECQIQ